MSIDTVFLSIFLSFLSLGTYAQNLSSISGYVRDSAQVVSDASIIIEETSIGTTTNNKGYYKLGNLKPGSYLITVSNIGYVKSSKQIHLKEGQQLDVDFLLKKDLNQLHDVAVTGKTTAQEIRESGFTVNAIEMKKFANTTADLNQILNRSTGVKIREQGGLGSDFNFSVNGLSGKQVRFFLDGIPMESFGGALSLNNIPVNLAERIEVYKGVVPVELGADALGGAVNIITDQHTKRFLDASYSYGSFNTNRAAINGRFTDEKTGLIFNFSGFNNYSDNDYLMRNNPKYDAPIEVNENGTIVQKDARRFHDDYRSTMGQLDVGITDKSWVDRLTLGLMYSSLYKEIQTGANQNEVFGQLNNRERFFMPSLKYKKDNFLVKGLKANITTSFSINRSIVADTASNSYNWGGKGRAETVAGELGQIKTLYHYKNKAAIVRANFGYELKSNHSLNLNYTFNHFGRTAKEELGIAENNSFDIPNTIDKNVLGLAYQNNLFDQRLTNTLFAKYYDFNAFVRDATFYSKENSWVKIDSRTNKNYFGYGLASRYKLSETSGIKLSYEHAYRLQEGEEMFGNGINVSSNTKLKPELSDNINLGAYYAYTRDEHRFNIEASYFYRNAKDFIYFIPTGGIFSYYENVGKAEINGMEGELRYNYSQLLDFSINANYQNSINKQKYQPSSTIEDATYGDKIPNQPWFYSNANIGIGKNDLLAKGSRIQFNWSTQYVHWFYMNWESRGSKESKNKIPSQLIHNVGLSYSFENGKYNISAESLNVTDELAYDNFRLQKPGRSFHLKLRYFIK